MKKIIAVIAVISLLFALAACGNKEPEVVEEPGIEVYTTISVRGELKLTAEKIKVTDADGDGKYTLDEVLKAAHKNAPAKEDSYASEEGQYGVSITKLWDDANGMSGYGYFINNVSAMSLLDEVKEGDYVYAYSFKDLTNWSDTYTWFDQFTAEGTEVTLHLNKMSYDANWNVVTADYAGAAILVNGQPAGTTDEKGNVTVKVNAAATVTAADENAVIVPPVCLVTGK